MSDQHSTNPPAAATAAPTSSSQQAISTSPSTSSITIDDFMKIQLKTAIVRSAERVPNSEKLIKLQVDLGSEQRQIVAGIGKKYRARNTHRQAHRRRGQSAAAQVDGDRIAGMVLAAGDANVEGLMTVVEDVAPGSR